MTISAELHESLVDIFTEAVTDSAAVPAARRADVAAAPTFSVADGEIVCTCGITGSTYSDSWDGSRDAATAFAYAVGQSTASLVARTKKNHKYAWLYATR